MNMRNLKRTFAIIGLLLIVVSCSKDESAFTSADEWGTASFDCSMLSSVSCTTRSSDIYYIPEDLIPATGDIVLKITGSYIDSETEQSTSYSYGPLSLSTYNTSQPMMIASDDYNAQFSWGTAGTEGESAPYFSGETDFEVIARGTTTEDVSLVLQNSIITVEFDEMFENYYSDASFTVSTGSGNSFDFSSDTTDAIVFVEASTTLTLSGSATKTRDGSSITFNAAVIGQTTAQTLSRINITADSIGGENINITVDDTITEMEPTQIELNPQGN